MQTKQPWLALGNPQHKPKIKASIFNLTVSQDEFNSSPLNVLLVSFFLNSVHKQARLRLEFRPFGHNAPLPTPQPSVDGVNLGGGAEGKKEEETSEI